MCGKCGIFGNQLVCGSQLLHSHSWTCGCTDMVCIWHKWCGLWSEGDECPHVHIHTYIHMNRCITVSVLCVTLVNIPFCCLQTWALMQWTCLVSSSLMSCTILSSKDCPPMAQSFKRRSSKVSSLDVCTYVCVHACVSFYLSLCPRMCVCVHACVSPVSKCVL